jgi:hypothetical protein
VTPEVLTTGPGLILVGRGIDGRTAAVAFDGTDTWTILPPVPIGGQLVDAAWTGASVVIVTDPQVGEDDAVEPGAAAVFDRSRGSWCEIPRPPVPGRVRLSWAGGALIAFGSPWPDAGTMQMSRFDMAEGAWSASGPTPIEGGAALPIGGALLFLGGEPPAVGTWDAWYDPSSDRWVVLDTPCPVDTSGGAIWTGSLVVDDTHAFEPATGGCFPLPSIPGGILRGSTLINADGQLIRWSGNEGEENPPVPVGWTLALER